MLARRPPQFADHFENRSQLVHPPIHIDVRRSEYISICSRA